MRHRGHPESAGKSRHGVSGEASTELSRSQVHYRVRNSDPLWPRAMPRRPVMAWGSVSRGVHRRSIEPQLNPLRCHCVNLTGQVRNHRSGVPTSLYDGEGNTSECLMRVLIRLPGVRDLWHVHKLHEREPGDLGSGCLKTVRPGKAKAEILACTLPRSRTGQ